MKRGKLTVIKHPRLLSGGGSIGMGPIMEAANSQMQDITNIARMFLPRQESPDLISRRVIRGYDLGGAMDIASTATKQVADGIKGINAVTDNARAIEEDVKGQKVNPSPSSSTDELLSKWSSWNPLSHITWKDLTNKGTALSYTADMLSNSSEGAASGSRLGPIGAVAGGIGGLASGFFGNLFAKAQAKKKANRINNIIDANNLYAQKAFSNQAEQLEDEMLANDLANFTGWSAAYGGPLFANGGKIHIDPENRGKFTETKRRTGKTTEELTHSSNPLTRKRAIFALNSRHWNKHSNGGYLEGKEYDLDELEIKRLIDAGYEIEYF